MPWEHCGQEVHDDASCPACGMTKDQWTVEWNVTRTFQVNLRARPQRGLRLLLLHGEAPVAGEPYEVTVGGEGVAAGELDEFGTAVADAPEGQSVVVFPRRAFDEVQQVDPALNRPAEAAPWDPGPWTGPEVPPARFACWAGAGRHAFALRVARIHAQLRDHDGPLPGLRYEVTLPDGRTLTGETDPDGLMTHLDVPVGFHPLSTPWHVGFVDAFHGEEGDPPSHVLLQLADPDLPTRIHARLITHEGPLAGARYTIHVAGGEPLEGETDADGGLTHEDVPIGYHEIEAGDWVGFVDAFPVAAPDPLPTRVLLTPAAAEQRG